ncbi:MAG: outer membrane lipid asymmetry maintenance protein MlaD [Pseudomonadota bacterium]
MLSTRTLETVVGFFVAFGIVALFFLAMRVSNLSDFNTGKGYVITARFENSGSLKVRSPVSIAGVRIGRVSAIRFDIETYQSIVEMRIEPRYDTLPTDTSASILTSGLLGEQYVGLEAGGETEYLTDGDTIELTQSALVLENMIGKFLLDKAEGGDK